MRLPSNAIIAPSKLTNYLLVFKQRNDKSKWLASAGYDLSSWRQLEHDLRVQILSKEAHFDENNRFGNVYRIDGQLQGPNGNTLAVRTVWMIEHASGQAKFITIYPLKGEQGESTIV
jgi:hypothetical protein